MKWLPTILAMLPLIKVMIASGVGTTIIAFFIRRNLLPKGGDMAEILEGKEIEGKIGNAGVYSVDIDAKGMIKIEAKIDKEVAAGVKVSSANSVEADIVLLIKAAADKSGNALLHTVADLVAKILGR